MSPDVDECSSGRHQCHNSTYCVNVRESYRCYCPHDWVTRSNNLNTTICKGMWSLHIQMHAHISTHMCTHIYMYANHIGTYMHACTFTRGKYTHEYTHMRTLTSMYIHTCSWLSCLFSLQRSLFPHGHHPLELTVR